MGKVEKQIFMCFVLRPKGSCWFSYWQRFDCCALWFSSNNSSVTFAKIPNALFNSRVYIVAFRFLCSKHVSYRLKVTNLIHYSALCFFPSNKSMWNVSNAKWYTELTNNFQKQQKFYPLIHGSFGQSIIESL